MEVTTMSIKAMKEELVSLGGSADGCLERAEVVSRLLEARDAERRIKRQSEPANNKRARHEDVEVIQDDNDNDADVPANRRQRTGIVDDVYTRIMSSKNWQDLFEVDSSVPTDEAQEMHARAIRNRLFRASHPDRAVQDEESQQRAHQATVRINQLWDQACSFFAAPVHAAVDHSNQPGNGGAVSSTLLVSRFLAPPDLPNEPCGSLEMLAKACHAQPPAMLQTPQLDAYTGFGSFDTLRSCRFLAMSTNRCVSQDVVAQRVCQNLRRLRERGAYYNFGQIACVAVRSPPEEQFIVEHGARFARFYVLDGQHRLRTMEELARERPNIPIWFELSVRVVQDKRAANEALLHMQHTYRADPKCFFTQDDEAEVAASTLDLAKISWPNVFRSTDADSFARPARPVIRPKLDDGLFYDLLRDTRLLEWTCARPSNTSHRPAAGLSRRLFEAVRDVNECLRKDAVAKHGRGELAERTFVECRDKLGGCFLGQYRRDKIGVALMELLRRNNLCPEHANCPIDEH